MTCQHCQAQDCQPWIRDEDHRCPRCGRRVRAVPSRISPSTYPIAATATARAYDFSTETAPVTTAPEPIPSGQQALFSQTVNPGRVVAFDSLTSPAARDAIRARAAELARPTPIKNERVELRRPRPSAKRDHQNQRSLEFFGQQDVVSSPAPSIICDAPVAPAALRLRATFIDGAITVGGCGVALLLFRFVGGHFGLDKQSMPFLAVALLTVPLFYKILWAYAGRDTIGMEKAGLRLVDFDGNPPSQLRRYQRVAGGIISLLAAGMGLIWSFVDEDRLTWHDHISSTFPTPIYED